MRMDVSQGEQRQRVAGRLLLLVALLFHLSLLISWRAGFWNRFTFDSAATQGWRGWDFFAIYQAGHNVLTGASIYKSDNDAIDVVVPRYTPYRYLPFPAYTLGVVLNAVPPLWAFRLWTVLIVLVWWACAWLSYGMGRDPWERAILASMWLLFSPFYLEIYLGQFSAIQGALVLLMLLAVSRRLPGWVLDASWAASLIWKQNTALLAPVLLRDRKWHALLVGAGAVLVTSVPYFLWYPGSIRQFGSNLVSGVPSHQLGNLGVRQLLYSITSAVWPSLPADAHSSIQSAWVIMVVVVGLVVTFVGSRWDPALGMCFWFTTYFVVYHHVWEHHYVMLLPVLVILYHRYRSPWLLLAYGLVALWTPYALIDPVGMAAYHAPMRWTPLDPPVLDVLYHASKAAPALGLWIGQAWMLGRPRRVVSS
ncbi:MAG: glycosyltransferase family 87 protein [Anaerolineae bacterium]